MGFKKSAVAKNITGHMIVLMIKNFEAMLYLKLNRKKVTKAATKKAKPLRRRKLKVTENEKPEEENQE